MGQHSTSYNKVDAPRRCQVGALALARCKAECVWYFVFRAVMYLSHGVGEHMGRYSKLGEELAERGILTFGHDHGIRCCVSVTW